VETNALVIKQDMTKDYCGTLEYLLNRWALRHVNQQVWGYLVTIRGLAHTFPSVLWAIGLWLQVVLW